MNIIFLGGCGRNIFNSIEEQYKIIEIHKYYIINSDDISKTPPLCNKPNICYEFIKKEQIFNDEYLSSHLDKNNLNVIIAGLGGYTGSNFVLAYSELFKKLNYFSCFIVTKPFKFEGHHREWLSDDIIKKLGDNIFLVIQNEKLLSILDRKTSIKETFSLVDSAVKYVLENIPDYSNRNYDNNNTIYDELVNNEELKNFLKNVTRKIEGVNKLIEENKK